MIIKNTLKKILIVFIFIISISSGLAVGYSYFDSNRIDSQESFSIANWLEYGTSYDFANMTIQDLEDEGALSKGFNNWVITDDGLYNQRNYGTIFIPNLETEYTISATTSMGDKTTGGYGIFFETYLSNVQAVKETGFILQFDRGYASGAIVLRPRENGKELSPVWVLKHNDTDLFPATYEDASWWSSEHTIEIKVEIISDTQKQATFYIDSNELGSYVFTYTIDETMYTGFRAWTGEAYFKELTIS